MSFTACKNFTCEERNLTDIKLETRKCETNNFVRETLRWSEWKHSTEIRKDHDYIVHKQLEVKSENNEVIVEEIEKKKKSAETGS